MVVNTGLFFFLKTRRKDQKRERGRQKRGNQDGKLVPLTLITIYITGFIKKKVCPSVYVVRIVPKISLNVDPRLGSR